MGVIIPIQLLQRGCEFSSVFPDVELGEEGICTSSSQMGKGPGIFEQNGARLSQWTFRMKSNSEETEAGWVILS